VLVLAMAMVRPYSDGNAIHYMLPAGFAIVNDVVFSYNAGNMPESKTTRMFPAVCQMASPGRSLPSPTASCWKKRELRSEPKVQMEFLGGVRNTNIWCAWCLLPLAAGIGERCKFPWRGYMAER